MNNEQQDTSVYLIQNQYDSYIQGREKLPNFLHY